MMPVEPPDNERVHAELPEQQAAIAHMRALRRGPEPAGNRHGYASRAIAAAVQARHGLTVSHVTVRAALARMAR